MIDSKKRFHVFQRDGFRCQHKGCYVVGYSDLEVAHRIANTKANAKWITNMTGYEHPEQVLDHPLNLKTSCRKHNDYFNIGNKPKIATELIYEILKHL